MGIFYKNPEPWEITSRDQVPHSDPVYAAMGVTVFDFRMLRYAIINAISRLVGFPDAAADMGVLEMEFKQQVRALSTLMWTLESYKLLNTHGLSALSCWYTLSAQCDRAFAMYEEVVALDGLKLHEMAALLQVAAGDVDRSKIVASRIHDYANYIRTLTVYLNDLFDL